MEQFYIKYIINNNRSLFQCSSHITHAHAHTQTKSVNNQQRKKSFIVLSYLNFEETTIK